MGKINLSGKQNTSFESFKLKHLGRMPATVAEVRPVFEKLKKFKNKDGIEEEKLQHKIPIEFRIRPEDIKDPQSPYVGRKEPVHITLLATTTVYKGSAGFPNSKLYDLMETAGLLQIFDTFANNRDEIPDEEIAQFLRSNLVGLRFEIEIANINRGTDKESSLIGKVVELIPNDSIGKAAQVAAGFGSGVPTQNR